MKCPYCKKNNMPPPPKSPRPFGRCPDCGKKSRAGISAGNGGTLYTHYSATGKKRLAPNEVKKVRTVRASDEEMRLVENGKLKLTIVNSRITIAV